MSRSEPDVGTGLGVVRLFGPLGSRAPRAGALRLTFCGTRGSTPTGGSRFVRYGGHTSCVAIGTGTGRPHLLIGAGTGIRSVTRMLGGRPFDGTILLGHLHWDHTQGLPFFSAAGRPGARARLLIPAQEGPPVDVLARFMSPPHFPIRPEQLGPGWTFGSVEEGEHRIEGYTVHAREIPHKGGRTFAYRVSNDRGSVAYLSDHSPTSVGPGPDGLGVRHGAALEIAAGADVLVHDAQQVAAELPAVGHLGHASVEYAVGLAAAAGVRTLVLFHHSPERTDNGIDQILAAARRLARALRPELRVIAAADGLCLTVGEIVGAAGRPAGPPR